jgi:hypothetical protein
MLTSFTGGKNKILKYYIININDTYLNNFISDFEMLKGTDSPINNIYVTIDPFYGFIYIIGYKRLPNINNIYSHVKRR